MIALHPECPLSPRGTILAAHRAAVNGVLDLCSLDPRTGLLVVPDPLIRFLVKLAEMTAGELRAARKAN